MLMLTIKSDIGKDAELLVLYISHASLSDSYLNLIYALSSTPCPIRRLGLTIDCSPIAVGDKDWAGYKKSPLPKEGLGTSQPVVPSRSQYIVDDCARQYRHHLCHLAQIPVINPINITWPIPPRLTNRFLCPMPP